MKPWFTPAPPRVLAHRGLAIDAPENSLLAFLQALAIGVTHLETDVQATADGIAVLSHDPDLGRITGVATPVDSLLQADLRRIVLPNDQEIATLAQALDAFPEARFNIDIKAEAALAPTIDVVKRLRAVDRVLVTSFDEKRRRRAVAALPGVATSPASRGVLASALASRFRVPWMTDRVFRGIDALQIPERFRGVPILTPALVRAAHRNGVEVHVWTVNDPVDMVRLLDLGVDGIITDRADLAMRIVGDGSKPPNGR